MRRYAQTLSIEGLAARHGRSVGAVTSRLAKLGAACATPRRDVATVPATDVATVPATMMTSCGGRVVVTHSTYCIGLLPALGELAKLAGVHTLTPGRLARARSKGSGGSLVMKVTTALPEGGGWKLLARRGTQTQEVFIVGSVERAALEAGVELALARSDRGGERERAALRRRHTDGPPVWRRREKDIRSSGR